MKFLTLFLILSATAFYINASPKGDNTQNLVQSFVQALSTHPDVAKKLFSFFKQNGIDLSAHQHFQMTPDLMKKFLEFIEQNPDVAALFQEYDLSSIVNLPKGRLDLSSLLSGLNVDQLLGGLLNGVDLNSVLNGVLSSLLGSILGKRDANLEKLDLNQLLSGLNVDQLLGGLLNGVDLNSVLNGVLSSLLGSILGKRDAASDALTQILLQNLDLVTKFLAFLASNGVDIQAIENGIASGTITNVITDDLLNKIRQLIPQFITQNPTFAEPMLAIVQSLTGLFPRVDANQIINIALQVLPLVISIFGKRSSILNPNFVQTVIEGLEAVEASNSIVADKIIKFLYANGLTVRQLIDLFKNGNYESLLTPENIQKIKQFLFANSDVAQAVALVLGPIDF